jgi:hypothetical protein
MRFILVASTLAIVLTATPGISEPSDESNNMAGLGVQTCEQFARDDAENPRIEDSYFAWAQGYMTGLNVARTLHKLSPKNLNSWTKEDQEAFVHNYCDQHPVAKYAEAAFTLFHALKQSGSQPQN